MNNIKISLVQTLLHWEDQEKNLNHLEGLMGALKGKTDIIVLPEMISSGFSMNTESLANTMDGKAVLWMQKMAQELNAVVCGSLIIEENNKYYNRFIWMQPDGTWQKYDKRHLFKMGDEHQYFTPGKERLIISYKGWKIMPLVCYDLRFPVWAKNKLINNEAEYDVLIYTANWPKVRSVAWKSLLLSRAIENQVYLAGVNRVGEDGKEIEYSGDSAIINPYGGHISQANVGEEAILTAELDYKTLIDFRAKFPVLSDADDFEIK
jgi:predicted amidohydrolase